MEVASFSERLPCTALAPLTSRGSECIFAYFFLNNFRRCRFPIVIEFSVADPLVVVVIWTPFLLPSVAQFDVKLLHNWSAVANL